MYSVSMKCIIFFQNPLIILLYDHNPRGKVNMIEPTSYGFTMTERLWRKAHGHNAAGDKAELDSHPSKPCPLSCQHPICLLGVELEYDSTQINFLGTQIPLVFSSIFFLLFTTT